MVQIKKIIDHCNQLLQPELFKDYCPNGLQISGKQQIRKIISGVSANQALIDAAIKKDADLILVHHGFFWRDENPILVGIKRQRVAALIKHDINLLSYHLPLDAHAELGNNAQLAKLLDIKITSEFGRGEKPALGKLGELIKPMHADEFSLKIGKILQRMPLHIRGHSEKIKSIAWCTGAAQDFILAAAEQGVDGYLTGEVSERTLAFAKELGIHFYAAGHHATERYGVQALGKHLADKFSLSHEFIDIENPI